MTLATVTPLAPSPRGAGRRIAVVGSGIAGLSAAWLLSQGHSVTVFEKAGWVGGHANTVDVETAFGPVAVDTGFICFNRPNYPNFAALLEHLGVGTKATRMSFAASVRGGEIEYSSADINGLIGHRGNLIRPRFWFMLRDIVRFYAKARTLSDGAHLDGITLGQFLDREGYSRGLVEDHVLPMCAAIWSTSASEIRDYPMRSYLRFFANHGLLDIGEQQRWQTVEGGSRAYVNRLKAAFADRIATGNGVRAIRRTGEGVTLLDAQGATHAFDDVVIAAHADEALALLDDADGEERRLLGAFRYTQNRAVLHDDAALMPRRRRVWASWNYIGGREEAGERPLCVSYWMNHLQGLDPRQPLFVTLNPIRDPRAGTVKAAFDYAHPLFDTAALKAQEQLWTLQGRRGTWFCGSYFGYGFHEDGLQAGLAVAERLGGVRRPWTVPNESGRIVLPPVAMVAAE